MPSYKSAIQLRFYLSYVEISPIVACVMEGQFSLGWGQIKTGVISVVHDTASPLFTVQIVCLSENITCVNIDSLFDH